jgi:hypothetical protein
MEDKFRSTVVAWLSRGTLAQWANDCGRNVGTWGARPWPGGPRHATEETQWSWWNPAPPREMPGQRGGGHRGRGLKNLNVDDPEPRRTVTGRTPPLRPPQRGERGARGEESGGSSREGQERELLWTDDSGEPEPGCRRTEEPRGHRRGSHGAEDGGAF